MRTPLSILLVLSLAACEPAAPAAELNAAPVADVDLNADRAELERMDDAYAAALVAGDPDAIIALHADDAVVLPGNSPFLDGREAFAAYAAERYGEGREYTATRQRLVVAESGDLAYAVATDLDTDGTGKYLTVYERTPDGWRIVADSWSTDAPPPAAN